MNYSEEPLTMHVHLPSGLAKEGTMVLIGIALVASVVFLIKLSFLIHWSIFSAFAQHEPFMTFVVEFI